MGFNMILKNFTLESNSKEAIIPIEYKYKKTPLLLIILFRTKYFSKSRI